MRSSGFWALALAVAGDSCSGTTVEPRPEPCELAKSIRSSSAFLGVPEEADIAARVLPGGFGGLYQDIGNVPGALVAFFKDVSTAPELRADVRKLLLCGGAYPGWAGQLLRTDLAAIEIRQGQYTGTELLSYFGALESLRSDPDVWAIEVDPQTNRVWIGLSNPSATSRIQQAAVALSVPADAVSIEPPPPTTGVEQFEILNSPVEAIDAGVFGVLFFPLRVRFTNRQTSTRYPDWCINQDLQAFTAYFNHKIQQWDGAQWKDTLFPICVLVLIEPRPIAPGETATDSVPVVGSRRLNGIPYWRTARITGTYRFVGKAYTSTTPNPSGGPPFVSDLAPAEEQISAPFRVINTLPF